MVMQNCKVDMIQLKEMFEAPTSFVRGGLAIRDLDRGYFNGSPSL